MEAQPLNRSSAHLQGQCRPHGSKNQVFADLNRSITVYDHSEDEEPTKEGLGCKTEQFVLQRQIHYLMEEQKRLKRRYHLLRVKACSFQQTQSRVNSKKFKPHKKRPSVELFRVMWHYRKGTYDFLELH